MALTPVCVAAQPDDLARIRAAADANDSAAQYRLGMAYQDGDIGIKPDASAACRWFERSAQSGYAQAQNALGGCYMSGEGTDRDPARAVVWYRKAAEQDLAPAQVNLGRAYRWGRGVERNYGDALKWFERASDRGWGGAEIEIAEMCEAGLGMPKDLTAAERRYRAAADRIVPLAFARLARFAETGATGPRDVVEAYKWYTLFLPFAGDDEATYRGRRDALAATMTREQIDDGIKRADLWADAHKPKR
jgi:uncharacterized protein